MALNYYSILSKATQGRDAAARRLYDDARAEAAWADIVARFGWPNTPRLERTGFLASTAWWLLLDMASGIFLQMGFGAVTGTGT